MTEETENQDIKFLPNVPVGGQEKAWFDTAREALKRVLEDHTPFYEHVRARHLKQVLEFLDRLEQEGHYDPDEPLWQDSIARRGGRIVANYWDSDGGQTQS